MKENLNNEKVRLEDHRFDVSPESIIQMKTTREAFKKIQEEHPELKAISFFGSRIRNQEKPNSDLDGFLFYNREEVYDAFPDADFITRYIQSSIIDKGKENGIHINPAFYMVDVSEENMKEKLDYFKTYEKDFKNIINDGTLSIVVPFLLSIGDIYKTRENILNLVEKEKNSELIFKDMMKCLEVIEKPITNNGKTFTSFPKYVYPQTIEDGRKYFLSHKQIDPNNDKISI